MVDRGGSQRSVSATPSPASERLRAAVSAAVAGFLAEKRIGLAELHPALVPVVEDLARRFRNGTSLRPAFTYWSWRGFASTAPALDEAAVVRAIGAAELLHLGQREHLRAGRDGGGQPDEDGGHVIPTDPRAGIGTEVPVRGATILRGDLALVWSDELLTRAGLPAATLDRIGPVWDRMRAQTIAGRYLDLLATAGAGPAGGATAPGAGDQAAASASGSAVGSAVAWPLRLGAALAEAGPAAVSACVRIGRPLDEIVSLRRASPGSRPGGDGLAPRRLASVPSGTDGNGGSRVDALLGRAREAIAAAPLSVDSRGALLALADQVPDLPAER